MIEYILNNYAILLELVFEHLQIVFISLSIGIIISLLISFLIYNIPFLYEPMMLVLRIIYTIPSLALFAFLIPITGNGSKNAIIVLSIYTLFFLVNNFLNGLYGIDEEVMLSAKAVGYTAFQKFKEIQLPLALPSIVTGIRLADISTIGIACIAYTIGAGGIGSILFEGMLKHLMSKY